MIECPIEELWIGVCPKWNFISWRKEHDGACLDSVCFRLDYEAEVAHGVY
jgi:hypothetical protein